MWWGIREGGGSVGAGMGPVGDWWVGLARAAGDRTARSARDRTAARDCNTRVVRNRTARAARDHIEHRHLNPYMQHAFGTPIKFKPS